MSILELPRFELPALFAHRLIRALQASKDRADDVFEANT